MSRVKTWEISDAFWKLAEPLLPQPKRDPQKKYKNKPGAGRPPADRRTVFSAIVFVLRTGIQWNALPREKFNVCPSSVHAYFQKWSRSGFFRALWQRGLVEYDELEGIAWEWQAMDGSMVKSPLGQEAVGPNPTDRGKKREQAPRFGRRAWRPVVDRRNRGKRE